MSGVNAPSCDVLASIRARRRGERKTHAFRWRGQWWLRERHGLFMFVYPWRPQR